jgi:hypothetical protein
MAALKTGDKGRPGKPGRRGEIARGLAEKESVRALGSGETGSRSTAGE